MKSWESALGQRFGDILQVAMDISFEEFVEHEDKGLKSIGGGKEKVLSGDTQQIDGRLVNSKQELIIIGESKWLKDQRHQNDKGAWITGLPDGMCLANPTIKGVIALLAGPWTGTPRHNQMIKQGTKTVVITLGDFKKFLHDIGLTTYAITPPQEGNTVVDPKGSSLQLCDLEENLLNKGLNPYKVWAKKVLGELKPEGKTVTVREAMAKYLSEINSEDSPAEQFTVDGFTLQVETNIGPFEIAGIDIDDPEADIVKAIADWKKDPKGMSDKLFERGQ